MSASYLTTRGKEDFMKRYFYIVKTKNVVEFDEKSITIYQKSTLGTRYIANLEYWKGEQSELIERLKSKITFNDSKLGEILTN